MPPMVYNGPRTKVQLRMAVQRLRVMQEKQAALAKAARREIAQLLERGRTETARIKVEGLIGDDIHVELLELMELYCELLIARFALLDMCPPNRDPDAAVAEGVAAVVHAAPRTELKELHVLREMLMHKFGREYAIAAMENKDDRVPQRVVSKLVIGQPPNALVDAYLIEIARGYNIAWTPPPRDDNHGNTDEDGPGGGGLKERAESEEPAKQPEPPLLADPKDTADTASLKEKVEADRAATRTPKLPDIPPTEGNTTSSPAQPPTKAAAKRNSEDDLRDLAARFAALKKPR